MKPYKEGEEKNWPIQKILFIKGSTNKKNMKTYQIYMSTWLNDVKYFLLGKASF